MRVDLANVQPGGELALPGRWPARVGTVMQCQEGSRTWVWIFLEDGSVLESSLGDVGLYPRHEVLERGTGVFETLVAQDGALVRYEARRRAGTVDRRPVRVTLGEREYQLTATGTVRVARSGDMPGLGAWRAIREDPAYNVYFRMLAVDGAEVVLGLWTDDLCLSFGRVHQCHPGLRRREACTPAPATDTRHGGTSPAKRICSPPTADG